VEGPLESSVAAAAPAVEAGPDPFKDGVPSKAADTPIPGDVNAPAPDPQAAAPADDTPAASSSPAADNKDEAVMLPLAPAGATSSAAAEGAEPEKGEGFIVNAEPVLGNPAVKERHVPEAQAPAANDEAATVTVTERPTVVVEVEVTQTVEVEAAAAAVVGDAPVVRDD
jgi:hypothetical protein